MSQRNNPQHNDIIFYNTPTGDVKIEVIFNEETFWLTQKRMAELFGVEVPAINKHLSNIYETGELDKKATISILKTVQNKLHFAISGKTAAQIIAERACADKPNMGLQTWKNVPSGKVLKGDIGIAKNYLIEKEIKELERIVSMYLDYAENQAARQLPMKMQDWVDKLDAFLQFNEYQILKDAGTISHKVAMKLAEKAYDKFRVIQDRNFESDFDKEMKNITNESRKKNH